MELTDASGVKLGEHGDVEKIQKMPLVVSRKAELPNLLYVPNCPPAEKRPVLSIDVSRWPQEKGADIEVFRAWLAEHGVGTLNVAGSRESKTPGLHAAVRQFLLEVLAPATDEALPLAAESSTEWGKP